MMRTLSILTTLMLGPIAFAPALEAGDYVILIHETQTDIALRNQPGESGRQYWEAWSDYTEKLVEAGVLRDGAAFSFGDDALSTDSPNRESRRNEGGDILLLGGYYRIETDTQAMAEAWARQAPSTRRGGAAEVRLSRKAPTMPITGADMQQ